MAQVGIVMGSDSDMPIMAKAADILDQLGVSYEMTIISAHREPDVFFEYAKSAEKKGFKVIIGFYEYTDVEDEVVLSTSAGHVRSNLPDAGHRNPDAHHFSWRKRFPVQYRADADRYSGSNRSNQRRSKCRYSCSKDSCNQ